MAPNKILVVTGMHRSGTSVVTQWLHECGLNVGDDLLGAGIGNAEGHFEDMDFLRAHSDFLKRRRLPEKGFVSTPLRPLNYEERDRLKDIIRHKNDGQMQWGWKEPRTCLFLDCYRMLIPDAFYLVVLRDYQSVVRSLIERKYHVREKLYRAADPFQRLYWRLWGGKKMLARITRKYSQAFLETWIVYSQSILEHLSVLDEKNYLVTDYAMLEQNDRPVFDRLVKEWRFSLNYSGFNQVFKASQMNQPGDIGQYIKDKWLIKKADAIQRELKQHSFNAHSTGNLFRFSSGA